MTHNPTNASTALVGAVEGEGFEIITGPGLCPDLDAIPTARFRAHWQNLPMDRFMADGGRYRYRRFGRFTYWPGTDTLVFHPGDTAFFQDLRHNHLNGGQARTFEPVTDDFAHDPILKRLICEVVARLPIADAPKIAISIHLIRIQTRTDMVGQATPEGIHQDGHDYVSQHLIDRTAVEGGESGIYDLEEASLARVTLHRFLDTVIVDDRAVKHGVTPITPVEGSFSGHRDMLLIDYNLPWSP